MVGENDVVCLDRGTVGRGDFARVCRSETEVLKR